MCDRNVLTQLYKTTERELKVTHFMSLLHVNSSLNITSRGATFHDSPYLYTAHTALILDI